MRTYFVYIATNILNTVLYTGITNDVARRMSEHRNKLVSGFTSKYNICKLVCVDQFPEPMMAIAAEKKIKGWLRSKKIALIKSVNPEFRDLASDFGL